MQSHGLVINQNEEEIQKIANIEEIIKKNGNINKQPIFLFYQQNGNMYKVEYKITKEIKETLRTTHLLPTHYWATIKNVNNN